MLADPRAGWPLCCWRILTNPTLGASWTLWTQECCRASEQGGPPGQEPGDGVVAPLLLVLPGQSRDDKRVGGVGGLLCGSLPGAGSMEGDVASLSAVFKASLGPPFSIVCCARPPAKPLAPVKAHCTGRAAVCCPPNVWPCLSLQFRPTNRCAGSSSRWGWSTTQTALRAAPRGTPSTTCGCRPAGRRRRQRGARGAAWIWWSTCRRA